MATKGESAEATSPSSPFFQPADRIDVRGVDVAYRRQGRGETLLYLHGLGMTRRWLPFYDELAQRFDVTVPEHPGFGDSELPDWLLEFSDLVLHYADLSDLLELDRFHLVGYGFGGWLAAELAVFYPERLRSLTLISPMGMRVEGHRGVDVYRLSAQGFGDALFNGHGDEYHDYLGEPDDQETTIHAYQELTAMARVAWNPRYDYRLERRLARVSCPTTVVTPDEDRLVPRVFAERYAELIEGARLVTISDEHTPTGHGVLAQQPKRLAECIAAPEA